MKNVWLAIAAIILLSACSSPESPTEVSLEKVENVPSDVMERIDPEQELQLHQKGKRDYYVILQSAGEVEAEVEKDTDLVSVRLKTPDAQVGEPKPHVYFLSLDEEIEQLEVLLNDEPATFGIIGY